MSKKNQKKITDTPCELKLDDYSFKTKSIGFCRGLLLITPTDSKGERYRQIMSSPNQDLLLGSLLVNIVEEPEIKKIPSLVTLTSLCIAKMIQKNSFTLPKNVPIEIKEKILFTKNKLNFKNNNNYVVLRGQVLYDSPDQFALVHQNYCQSFLKCHESWMKEYNSKYGFEEFITMSVPEGKLWIGNHHVIHQDESLGYKSGFIVRIWGSDSLEVINRLSILGFESVDMCTPVLTEKELTLVTEEVNKLTHQGLQFAAVVLPEDSILNNVISPDDSTYLCNHGTGVRFSVDNSYYSCLSARDEEGKLVYLKITRPQKKTTHGKQEDDGDEDDEDDEGAFLGPFWCEEESVAWETDDRFLKFYHKAPTLDDVLEQ